MRKYSIQISVVILILSMCFCAFTQPAAKQMLIQEGFRPYEFTEQDKSLLREFGIYTGSNAMMYQFHAPEEAVDMLVRVYQLENGRWLMRDKFGISIGEEREPVDRLSGMMSIHCLNKSDIVFRIHCAGIAEFPMTLEEIEDMEGLSWGYDFLDTCQQIQTGKEIPILLLAYNHDSSLTMTNLDNYLNEIPETIPEDEAGDNLLDILVTVTFNE